MQVIKKNNNEVDGTGGYLIKKSGAARFIDYYTMHSMTRAIDASIIDNFNDQLYELNEYLIKSIGIQNMLLLYDRCVERRYSWF